MNLPNPTPSECIDFTPSDLWPVIRSCYPNGVELPATVPKDVWDLNWKSRNPDRKKAGEEPPPPPALWTNYWGKLRNRALEGRRPTKKQKISEDPDPLPPAYPARLSKDFWKKYFDIFPCGHSAPCFSSSTQGTSWQKNSESSKYAFVNGSLHVNIAKQGKHWVPSTGVDSWDDKGNWQGPG
jgi:hypothetical protein